MHILWAGFNVTFLGCSHDTHCWPLTPLSSFPGRPIPPTSSSSLLPSAQLPSSHNPPPVSCQMPLLDSNTSHQIMDTNPDEEFSPNSYLLRACSGPQQASSGGKETVVSECVLSCAWPSWVSLKVTTIDTKKGRRWWCGGHQGETHSSFSWRGRSKMHLLKVTAVGESFFADSNWLWASFRGRILPMATCESMLGSKVKCGETLEYCVLYYCDSGHSQVTLDTLTCLYSYASLFPCFFIIGFWLPLPCLFYIVLRLKCAPLTWLRNTVPRLRCLGVWPLYDPLLVPFPWI